MSSVSKFSRKWISSKKWVLCAATGLAVGPATGLVWQLPATPAQMLRAEEAPQSAEPDRINPAVATQELNADGTSPVSPIRQTQGVAPTQQPKSEIMQQLEALYAQDGREMPDMTVPQVNATAPPQQMPQQIQPATPRTESRTSSKPSLFKRLFRFGRPQPDPEPVRPPMTNVQRPVPARPQAIIGQQPAPNAPQPFQSAGTETQMTVRPTNQTQVQSAVAAQQSANPRQPMPLIRQTNENTSIRVSDAKTQDEVDELVDDALENPFPEVSESEADQSPKNPFQGLRLESEIPVVAAPPKEMPRVNFDEPEPAPPLPDAAPGLPSASAFGEIAPVNSEVPTEDVEAPELTQDKKMQRIHSRATLSGLKGFCIVSLRDHRQLRDAKPEHHSVYDGKSYQFSSADAKAAFDREPGAYAPAAGGNDVVVHREKGVRVEGTLDHAAWFRGRLYLFTTAETLARFEAAPAEYPK